MLPLARGASDAISWMNPVKVAGHRAKQRIAIRHQHAIEACRRRPVAKRQPGGCGLTAELHRPESVLVGNAMIVRAIPSTSAAITARVSTSSGDRPPSSTRAQLLAG